MDQQTPKKPSKPFQANHYGEYPQGFKNPFIQSGKTGDSINQETSTDHRKNRRISDIVGSPKLGETSLSIRCSQSNARKPSYVSSFASSPSPSSSKRGSAFINLVSSEEDDDIPVITPKKAKRTIIEKSRTPDSRLKHHEPSNASTHTANNTITNHHIPAEAFRHIEIPTRSSGSVVPATSLATAQRTTFLNNLSVLQGPPVTVVNYIDATSPPTSFRFVNESVLGTDVSRAPDEVMIGCDCKEHYGPNPGCQYLKCECLDDSALNESGSRVFPYSSAQRDKGCLRPFYLESRHHIYECNDNCNCNDDCKNRNVQFGRRVPLEIFKTTNRGWGLRCLVDLTKGSFVDTYRGEIITVEEANARASKRSADEGNYFMNFDKWTEPEAIPKSEFKERFSNKKRWHDEKVKSGDWKIYRKDGKKMWLNPEYEPYLYVCDGMHVGGPTRFMNHSCDPNCRLFTVSYNHSDRNIYDLAFFTVEAIPAATELTFDYKDEDDRSVITHEQALEVKHRDGYMPQKCLCGTAECRQYFFN
ncbi:MAG: hypothetical protein L6R41_001327 [Letrouitia leprolyta]|nr:MAG: hypothetical protein L6R41_001327 [Letrouitia leprolyta]